jgi:molybdopterin/thiamine biosynthesis adenylyltransferase
MRSITMSKSDFDHLRRTLFTEDGEENAAFALCGYYKSQGDFRLLVRKVVNVPLEAYRVRTGCHLEISPNFINSVIDLAQSKFAIVIVHSHRGAPRPTYSPSDNFGEARLLRVFRELIPRAPHASLLFGERTVVGRYLHGKRFRNLGPLFIRGRSLRFLGVLERKSLLNEDRIIYDRQITAFGEEFQATLKQLRVAVVGLGGTGSAVAEQLVRIGCRSLVLVDPDKFEPSNASRMYGSFSSSRQTEFKTEIIKAHLEKINPKVRVAEIRDSVVEQRVLESITNCDIAFSCTDNDWSRSVLNRFAYQYLIPVIDMGVRVVVRDGAVVGAAGRVSMIGPGLSCLWCRHHLSSERIRAESMDERERNKLAKEGYIQGLDIRAPAVISLNSTLASMAVTMLLSSISGFSSVPAYASEQIYDALEGIVFRSEIASNKSCTICGDNGLQGLGALQRVSAYD